MNLNSVYNRKKQEHDEKGSLAVYAFWMPRDHRLCFAPLTGMPFALFGYMISILAVFRREFLSAYKGHVWAGWLYIKTVA
jgi:hypothetical protein